MFSCSPKKVLEGHGTHLSGISMVHGKMGYVNGLGRCIRSESAGILSPGV